MFNIYYINYSKVFEIRMLFNNTLKIGRNVENTNSNENEQEERQELGATIKIPEIFINAGTKGFDRIKKSETLKMIETLEIKNTKSILLAEVVERSIEFDDKKLEAYKIVLHLQSCVQDFECSFLTESFLFQFVISPLKISTCCKKI